MKVEVGRLFFRFCKGDQVYETINSTENIKKAPNN